MAKYRLIAATGCPTGIAHTYMAQEALEQAAKKKGITIKVETHGQVGVENRLTDQEIIEAEAVIIAADKDVQPERFAGKRIIDVSVSKGIKEADQLIAAALNGEGVISEKIEMAEGDKEKQHAQQSIGHGIYKNLMNGVSHMLPFVVSGGVLIAISFLWGIYSADPANAQYNEFAASLNRIGGFAMSMMVPVLSAFIAEGIAKRPGLVVGFVGGLIASDGGTGFLGGIISGFLAGYVVLGLIKVLQPLPKTLDGLKAIFLYPVLGVLTTGLIMTVISGPMASINEGMMDFLAGFENSSPLVLGVIVGCMCAFDMGGPINKAAYVTGTALLAQGNTSFMAGVSAACIAPPFDYWLCGLAFWEILRAKRKECWSSEFHSRLNTYYGRCDSFCGKRSASCLANHDAWFVDRRCIDLFLSRASTSTPWRISRFTSSDAWLTVGSCDSCWFYCRGSTTRLGTTKKVTECVKGRGFI